MPEKTPREVGEEAKVIYAKHKDIANQIDLKDRYMFQNTWDAVSSDRNLKSIEQDPNPGSVAPTGKARERYARERDRSVSNIGPLALEKAHLEIASDANIFEAQQHLEDNSAQYHDLAVHEAALDGVKVNVAKSEESDEEKAYA